MLPVEQLDNLMVKTGIWARAHVATLTARHTLNFQYSKNDLIRSRQLQIIKTLQNPIQYLTSFSFHSQQLIPLELGKVRKIKFWRL